MNKFSIQFDPNAVEDIAHWQKTDAKTVVKIAKLIVDISKHPFTGIGKPKPLVGELKGAWSRRIVGKHRLVYYVHQNERLVVITQMRMHYSDH